MNLNEKIMSEIYCYLRTVFVTYIFQTEQDVMNMCGKYIKLIQLERTLSKFDPRSKYDMRKNDHQFFEVSWLIFFFAIKYVKKQLKLGPPQLDEWW